MEDKKQLRRIRFEYADNLNPDAKREQQMVRSANNWFEPLIDEINAQEGEIIIFFADEFNNRVRFKGFDDELDRKMEKQFNSFRPPSQ